MKKFILISLLAAGFYSGQSQEKYALLLSSEGSAVSDLEKEVARNNVGLLIKGLKAQQFPDKNIRVIKDQITPASFLSHITTVSQQAKKGDIVVVYTDFPFALTRVDGKLTLQLQVGKNAFLDYLNLSSFINRMAVKLGDENLIFPLFDSEMPAGADQITFERSQLTLNAAFAAKPGSKRIIKDGASVFLRAFVNAMIKGSFSVTDYNSFFVQVLQQTLQETSLQEPTFISGPGKAFNGNFSKNLPHFTVSVKKKDSVLIINAGEAQMLSLGSTVKLGKAYEEDNILAEGKIIEVNSLSAAVLLNKPVIEEIKNIWVFPMVSQLKGNLKLNVGPPSNVNISIFQKLMAAIRNSGAYGYFTEVTSGGDLKIGSLLEMKDSIEVTLVNPLSGIIFQKIILDKQFTDVDWVANYLKQHAIYNTINKLENSIPELQVEARLTSENGGPLKMQNGYPIVFDNDQISFVIENNSGAKMYYGIVDLQPDKKAIVIVPGGNEMAADYFIPAGGKQLLEFRITPPFGRERLKLFTSLEPLTVLESLRSWGTKMTRGSSQDGSYLPSVNIQNLDFEIRNKVLTASANEGPEKLYELAEGGFEKGGGEEQVFFSQRIIPNKPNSPIIRFENNSTGRLYLNIIRQEKDGGYKMIFPNTTLSPEAFFVDPGKAMEKPWTGLSEEDQFFTILSDRPFNLVDYTNAEKSLNDRLVEILKYHEVSGSVLKTLTAVPGVYKGASLVKRNNTDISIRLITPKLSVDRGGEVEAKGKMFDIAGLAFDAANMPVKEIRINGKPVSYEKPNKLFEHSVELQSGVNKIVIEAVDAKGFTTTKVLLVELKTNNQVDVNAPGKNYFLGIGIDNYRSWSHLNNAERDVVDFSALLNKKFGFDTSNIRFLLDTAATRGKIINEIRSFLYKTGPNDNVIIYLSGHGNEDAVADGDFYFIPQDGAASDLTTAVKSSDIIDHFKKIKAKHCVLFVDACYAGMITNNLNINSSLLNPGSEAQVTQMPSKWIVASAMATKARDGEPGGNSPFARALINYLSENNDERKLTITSLIEYLQEIVPKTNAPQQPMGMKIDGRGIMVFKMK
jgi:glycosylphosphatidylinositol transamidase (GPIT) subunit GPI8